MSHKEAKQVIIVRKDLGMRKGKMIAQGAHASMKAILDLMLWERGNIVSNPESQYGNTNASSLVLEMLNNSALAEWLEDGFAKIAVGADSEEELLELYSQAQKAGLPSALILDSGRTEFHGEPTHTAVAIGPAWSDQIDPITGHLKLL